MICHFLKFNNTCPGSPCAMLLHMQAHLQRGAMNRVGNVQKPLRHSFIGLLHLCIFVWSRVSMMGWWWDAGKDLLRVRNMYAGMFILCLRAPTTGHSFFSLFLSEELTNRWTYEPNSVCETCVHRFEQLIGFWTVTIKECFHREVSLHTHTINLVITEGHPNNLLDY